MKKDFYHTGKHEIEIVFFFRSLWSKKNLLFFITSLFSLIGFLYGFFQSEQYKAKITTENIRVQILDSYAFLYEKNDNNIYNEFNTSFKIIFLSRDNLQSYLEQRIEINKSIDKNLKSNTYFSAILAEDANEKDKNSKKINNSDILNKYYLVSNRQLDLADILNGYVEYTKNKNIFNFKKNLQLLLKNKIAEHERALELAQKIRLDYPILLEQIEKGKKINEIFNNEPYPIFYRGSKIISTNLTYLKDLLIQLEKDQFHYSVILDRAVIEPQTSKYLKASKFAFSGFFVGFFFSIFIIFFKNILPPNKS
jgi:LPS O-antigen subunit length determinant protein (WzzB/FepE family)